MKRNIKTLLRAAPIVIAGFIPMKKADGQAIRKDHKVKMEIENPNTVAGIFQPGDMGHGIMYSRMITPRLGAYSTFSWGNYRFNDGGYIDDHIKASAGGIFYLKENFDGSQGYFMGGITNNHYGERDYTPELINKNALKPWAAEAGAGVKLGKLDCGLLFNLKLRGVEGGIYMGYSF